MQPRQKNDEKIKKEIHDQECNVLIDRKEKAAKLKRETHQTKVEVEAVWVKKILKESVDFDLYLLILREAESKAQVELLNKGIKISGRSYK